MCNAPKLYTLTPNFCNFDANDTVSGAGTQGRQSSPGAVDNLQDPQPGLHLHIPHEQPHLAHVPLRSQHLLFFSTFFVNKHIFTIELQISAVVQSLHQELAKLDVLLTTRPQVCLY